MRESPQAILRRLQLLYHHGYLERPRAQLDYYHSGGSRPIVYALARKGAAFLKQEPGRKFQPFRWSEKHQSVGRVFLEHDLFVSDVMVTIELACCNHGEIRFISKEELLSQAKRVFRWKVNINGQLKLSVVPDSVFGLEFTDTTGKRECAFFFLEADRGTMPVNRRNLSQTSFYRKMLAYEASWYQSMHTKRFGFHRFRVLTVTTNTTRVNNLVGSCSQLKSGRGLFLFTDRNALRTPPDVFSPIWQSATQAEPVSLLPKSPLLQTANLAV